MLLFLCFKFQLYINKNILLFPGMSSHSAAVSMEPLGPGATLSDRLRLAASKGQITEAQELYRAGAHFDADRVGKLLLIPTS